MRPFFALLALVMLLSLTAWVGADRIQGPRKPCGCDVAAPCSDCCSPAHCKCNPSR